jgi:hypothetical protein
VRIETKRTNSVGKSSSGSRAGSGPAFVPAGENAPARVAAAAPVASAAGIDAILALQGVEDATTGRKRAVRRGGALLDMLDDIKADLLIGRISLDRLDHLSGLLNDARERSVPELDGVLDEIELRVRVELAKFGRFPA